MYHIAIINGHPEFFVNGQTLPEDSLAISETRYFELLAALGAGKVLSISGDNVIVNDAPDNPSVTQQPISVSPWQLRKALNELNLRDQVEAAVAASEDQDLKDGWEFATEFVESDPLVINMANAIQIDQAALHNLFVLAKTK